MQESKLVNCRSLLRGVAGRASSKEELQSKAMRQMFPTDDCLVPVAKRLSQDSLGLT